MSYSIEGGNGSGLFEIDAASGELFYIGTGEDFEAGTGPFELTVRASDGSLSVDTTVTVGVTDVPEAPAFSHQGYAFDLAENEDGSTSRVSLGTVAATDPEGASLAFSIEGGNSSGLFEIDAASGELFYIGTGEDFEAGTGPFELTVRASDGSLSVDTTVTVGVTDVPEAPAFSHQGYAFDLAENEDGSTSRVSLGTVAATDPEGASLAFSIEGGNSSGLFEIDAASGELFYIGSGEDHEAGIGSFELTVRASDGSLSIDTTVTVGVTDVPEAPAFSHQDYAFNLAENEDGSTSRVSLGTVAATDPEGASLAFSIEGGNSSGLFEIDASSGELFYIGSGEDFEAGIGSFELTVRASDGNLNTDTIATISVTDVEEAPTDADSVRAGATDLGDITALEGPRFRREDLDGTDDAVDYYRFTLTEAREIGLGVRRQDADADLFIEDADGTVLFSSTESGTASEAIWQTLEAGTYYVRVAAREAGANAHVFRYGVEEPAPVDDYASDATTTGQVEVGGSATGEIETGNDFDWFAVELEAGRTYVIDLEGNDTGGGTLDSTVLRGLYGADGNRISGTQTNGGGEGDNARLTWTAPESGTYYIAARGYSDQTGTYTVRVTETTPAPDEAGA